MSRGVVEWLFLAVPWDCLWFMIVVFPDHTHLLFIVILLLKIEREVGREAEREREREREGEGDDSEADSKVARMYKGMRVALLILS